MIMAIMIMIKAGGIEWHQGNREITATKKNKNKITRRTKRKQKRWYVPAFLKYCCLATCTVARLTTNAIILYVIC